MVTEINSALVRGLDFSSFLFLLLLFVSGRTLTGLGAQVNAIEVAVRSPGVGGLLLNAN